MAQRMIWICDVCGQECRENGGRWMRVMVKTEFILTPWRSDMVDGPNIRHLCGRTCAQKDQHRWMEEQSSKPELSAVAGAERVACQ